MTDREKTLSAIDLFCTKNNLPYMVIGGVAAIAYGIQRFTMDIDVTIATELNEIQSLGKKLLEHDFLPRKENSLRFFQQNFVLPLKHKTTGIPINVAAGVSQFDRNAINRARTVKIDTLNFSVCSPEDLIIYKLVAARLLDLYDVELLFKFHKESLDRSYLMETAKGFQEIERSDVFETVQAFIKKYMVSPQ